VKSDLSAVALFDNTFLLEQRFTLDLDISIEPYLVSRIQDENMKKKSIIRIFEEIFFIALTKIRKMPMLWYVYKWTFQL
jgi:hypothetical protein